MFGIIACVDVIACLLSFTCCHLLGVISFFCVRVSTRFFANVFGVCAMEDESPSLTSWPNPKSPRGGVVID